MANKRGKTKKTKQAPSKSTGQKGGSMSFDDPKPQAKKPKKKH